MATTPCALIASCSDFSPDYIVKKILQTDDLSVGQPVIENIRSYPWHVETKYYTADVLLCTTESRTIGDETFAESVQALILIFDSKKVSSFEKVESWMPFAKELDAGVEILVCESSQPGDSVSRSKVQTWCLEKGFELVELDSETSSDDEDDFPETTGVERIVQALHAHMWPNLVMKETPSFRSPYMNQMMVAEADNRESSVSSNQHSSNHNSNSSTRTEGNSEVNSSTTDSISTITADPGGSNELNREQSAPDAQPCEAGGLASADDAMASTPNEQKIEKNKSNLSETSTDVASGATQCISKEEKNIANSIQAGQETIESLINSDDLASLSALGSDDTSEETFEQLFEKMSLMKQRAEALPPDQRKAYAEQVALTFWRAIGGDEAEIGGLSEDEES